MNKLIKFHYRILGTYGTCQAVSVAQAVDRAKVSYLRAVMGLSPNSPRFRAEKSKLGAVRLTIDPNENRMIDLYRRFRDGDCSPDEVQELNQLRTILEDLAQKG